MCRKLLNVLLLSGMYLFGVMVPLVLPVHAEIHTTTSQGLWLSIPDVKQLPMSGPAWDNLKQHADAVLGPADIKDQKSQHNINALAVSLVYARMADKVDPSVSDSYRKKAADAILAAIGTESGTRSLALGRNIAAYVIAADLINLADYNANDDAQFKAWLKDLIRNINGEGRSVITCHNIRPNNWGTMCGASRIAVDLYLDDAQDLAEAIKVFKGYSGDRMAWDKFKFARDATSFMCDPNNPRPMNPEGCMKDGHNMSGSPVDDIQRAGPYDSTQWFESGYANHTNYAWGGFSGAVAQAELLHRAGYAAYEWQDRAMFRGAHFLDNIVKFALSNPTEWVPWVLNFRYGTDFTTETPVGMGRLIGWGDWTHGSGRSPSADTLPPQPPKGLRIIQY